MSTAVSPRIQNHVILDLGPQEHKSPQANSLAHLLFKGPQTVITLSILDRSTDPPRHINATVEQIQNLTLRSIFFKKNKVKPELPEKLGHSQTYQLQIISNERCLKARVIYDPDKQALFKLLNDKLTKELNRSVKKFEHYLRTQSFTTKLPFDELIPDLIYQLVESIDKPVLKDLLAKIQASAPGYDQKTKPEQIALAKENFKACFDAISDKNLIRIIKTIFINTLSELSLTADSQDFLKSSIDKIAERFKDRCRESTNPCPNLDREAPTEAQDPLLYYLLD